MDWTEVKIPYLMADVNNYGKKGHVNQSAAGNFMLSEQLLTEKSKAMTMQV